LTKGASDDHIIEEFYLAALARSPTAGERTELLNFVAGGPRGVRILAGLYGRSSVHESLRIIIRQGGGDEKTRMLSLPAGQS